MDTVASTTAAASAVISASKGAFYGATLTGGSDAATLIVYDNATEASGTVILKLGAAAGATASWAPGVRRAVSNGVYAALTGTAPSATVLFTP